MQHIQAIRGMHDLLPPQSAHWQFVEGVLRRWATSYGYDEIRFPIVEQTELFKRTIGEVTDIVEKEMYTFDDRNGDSLTLRPEGTASCVRAGVEHGLFHNQVRRLWYMGPMFRHERPQKGRYRQFHQLGVELFGVESPDADAELILMTARLWRLLGLADVRLEVNSLGSSDDRARYREALVSYLERHSDILDEDSKRRLHSNPLRILDSKNPAMRSVIAAAPALADYLSEESKAHFHVLKSILDAAGVEYQVNPRLVRGLDYYGRTVFEWITDSLGAQGTVCAGGRYDGLVAQLGGKPTPAAGFAMGLERIIALLEAQGCLPDPPLLDCYLVLVGGKAQRHGLLLAEKLRDWRRPLNVQVNCGGGSFKAQMKRADKSGARLALIIGDDEIEAGCVAVKYLREDRPQHTVPEDKVWPLLDDVFGAADSAAQGSG